MRFLAQALAVVSTGLLTPCASIAQTNEADQKRATGAAVAINAALRLCPFVARDAKETLARIDPAQAFSLDVLQDTTDDKVWGKAFPDGKVVLIIKPTTHQCSVTYSGAPSAALHRQIRDKLMEQGFMVDGEQRQGSDLVELFVDGKTPLIFSVGREKSTGNTNVVVTNRAKK